MEEHSYFENCNENDVLSCGNLLFKVSKIKQVFKESLLRDVSNALENALRAKLTPDKQAIGADTCFRENSTSWEILKLGAKNWQKGKIRVRVIIDFHPDEPEKIESPLDDIRQTIN